MATKLSNDTDGVLDTITQMLLIGDPSLLKLLLLTQNMPSKINQDGFKNPEPEESIKCVQQLQKLGLVELHPTTSDFGEPLFLVSSTDLGYSVVEELKKGWMAAPIEAILSEQRALQTLAMMRTVGFVEIEGKKHVLN